MLKFEFVQGSEFSNPLYDVYDDDDFMGDIFYNKSWIFQSSNEWGSGEDILKEIANKIHELNESTMNQRILGVF